MTTSDKAQGSGRWNTENRTGLILFIGAFLFYALQAPRFAVPGRWADMLVSFSGLDPFRLLLRPIWSTVMIVFNALPFPDLAYAVNLLSALLGATVCWLVYEIIRRVPFVRGRLRSDRSKVERVPRLVAGITAALYSTVSLTMMAASTRGDFSVFDALLLCLAVYPSLLYLQNPKTKLLYISFFVYGLGAAEYPALAPVFPGFIVWWAVITWHRLKASKLHLLYAAVVAVATMLVVVFSFSLFYAQSPVAAFREMAGLGAVLGEFFRFYYIELTRSVPKVGWLLILFSSLLPFFFVMFKRFDEPTDVFTAIGVYLFRVILFVLGIVTLFSLIDSPASDITGRTLLVVPSLISASWFGFLVGYHYGLMTRQSKRWPRQALLVVLALLFVLAGLRHMQRIDVSGSSSVAAFSEHAVELLQDKNWVLTDGTLDSSVLLSARDSGKKLQLLNAQTWNSQMHVKYYTSLFESPELKNMAALGFRPLMNSIKQSPEYLNVFALLISPEIIDTTDLDVLPATTLYRLQQEGGTSDPIVDFRKFQTYLETERIPDLSSFDKDDTGYRQALFVVQWLSRIANELGVRLDESGNTELAGRAYDQALAISEDNISATINLISLAKESDPEQVERLEAQLDQQLVRTQKQYDLRFINHICGTVRNPSIALAYAALLGKAGQVQQSVQQLDKIAELVDTEDVSAQLTLARLYLQARRIDESEEVLNNVISKDAGNTGAIYGQLLVARARSDFDRAKEILAQLTDMGFDADKLALESVEINIAAGQLDEAKNQLMVITRDQSAPIEAWYSLATIAVKQKDAELMEQVYPVLDEHRAFAPGMFLLGEVSVQQRDMERARNYFEQVIYIDPSNVPALGRLVQLAYDRRDVHSLRKFTSALLVQDPNHAFGNYAAASIQIANENYELAEIALRKSLEISDFSLAHNDLAWILAERGELEEALSHVNRAIEINPQDANSWDTIAGIQMKMGDPETSLKSIKKAMNLSQKTSPEIMIHAVNLYIEAGKGDEARALVEELRDGSLELPANLLQELDRLSN